MADPFDTPGYRFAVNNFPGDGSTTDWNIDFAGRTPGYISIDHVRAALIDDTTGEETPVLLGPANFILPTRIRVTPAVPVGVTLRVWRDTPKDVPMLDYTDGALMVERNLDTSNEQNIYAIAEMVDRFADSLDDVREFTEAVLDRLADVEEQAQEAYDISNTAISTANTALANSVAAVNTANDALAGVAGAEQAAIEATEAADNANAAAVVATNAANAANQAAQDATDTAALAVSIAQNAEDVANGIDAKATQALEDSEEALTVANGISAVANTALDNSEAALTGVSDIGDSADLNKGAALVGYKGRTVTERLSETFSILDYKNSGESFMTGTGNDGPVWQRAIDAISAAGGGTLVVPYVGTGTTRITQQIVLKPGVKVVIDEGVHLLFRDLAAGVAGMVASGSVGPEIRTTTNMTSGDSTFTTATAHGLSPGDWVFVKSQRACLHADAGKDWCLGEPTASVLSPFFAEVVRVSSVTSSTTFVSDRGLIFPNYNTDNSQETYENAREGTTIQKINFLEGVHISGGRWTKATGRNHLVQLSWCLRPYVNIPYSYIGSHLGMTLSATSCYQGKFIAKAYHDPNYNTADAAANPFKDIGSWYCDWDVYNEHGSQGWDQTYESGGHPSIWPRVRAVGVAQYGTAGTSHGGTYGLIADVLAVRCRGSGFLNRGRFARINLEVMGAHPGSTTAGSGLIATYMGMFDGDFTVRSSGVLRAGVEFNAMGISGEVPYFNLNSSVSLRGARFTQRPLVFTDRTVSPAASSDVSGVHVKEVMFTESTDGVYVGTGYDCVQLDYVKGDRITGVASNSSLVQFANAANEAVLGTIICGSAPRLIYKNAAASPFRSRGMKYDPARLQISSPAILMTAGAQYTSVSMVAGPTGTYEITRDDAGGRLYSDVNADRVFNISLAASGQLPMLSVIYITNSRTNNVMSVTAESGVTLVTKRGIPQMTGFGVMTITKVGPNIFAVGGDNDDA